MPRPAISQFIPLPALVRLLRENPVDPEPVAHERGKELGRLARAMERMRRGLVRRDEQLRLMLAQVAHEIRNPLGSIRGSAQVLAEVGPIPPVSGSSYAGHHGVFADAEQAIAAATDAYEQLRERSMEDRKRIIDIIRRISIDQSVELGTMEMEETKIGRLDHKIEKLKTLGDKTPGVEFLRSEANRVSCSELGERLAVDEEINQ